VFGTRDVMFIHFGIGSIPFALLMIIWNEWRKYMVFLNIKLIRLEIEVQARVFQVGG